MNHCLQPLKPTLFAYKALKASRATKAMGIKNLRNNPLLLTDAYNLSHQGMKINTDWEVSHIYNRTAGQILFGFHEAIATFLGDISVTNEMITEAMEVAACVKMVFPADLFKRVVDECDGKIPLRVQALPEGTYCPAGTPFAQVSNTREGFGELVTYWEATFLHTHFSSSCATEAWKMRKYLNSLREEYGYPESFLNRFASFGLRGHRSLEDAMWAGSAWSLFLSSSDDLHIAYHHPDANIHSIPALAHKVVSQFDDENDSFIQAIDYAHEAGYTTVALVIDTYDVYQVINNRVQPLAEYAEQKGIHVIFRPDSSDTWQQTVDIFKVVQEHELSNVSVIIGESMSLVNAQRADVYFQKHNVPLTFVSYGIGAGFYKHIERDTCGYAMKTAYSNGRNRMKFSGEPTKRSIPGRVALFNNADGTMCAGFENEIQPQQNLYIDIYNDTAEAVPIPTLTQIREAAMLQSSQQELIDTTQQIKHEIERFREKYL